MQRTVRTRSVDRGLVRVEPSDNVLVAYASREGTIASDGDGRHSPFTTALLNNLETPGLEINFLFRNVRDEVLASTKREQQPFVYGSLSKQAIYLKEPAGTAQDVAPSSQPVQTDAAQAWSAAQGTTSQAVLESFIRRYSDSFYADLARARLEELKKSQVAVVAPPIPELIQPPLSSTPCGYGHVSASFSSRAPCPLSPEEERLLFPKDIFKECEKCPEMRVVLAGSFMMGAPNLNEGSESEMPQHTATISRNFAVGRFSITFDEWDACVADGGCNNYRPDDRGWGRGRRPVIDVNWDDAKSYVTWLSRKTAKPYRLLSEAEREYVTRAVTTAPCSLGSSISTGQANNDRHPLPVESFQPNPWGLYQVCGNVREWVEDCYHSNYHGAPRDGSAWTSGDCSSHACAAVPGKMVRSTCSRSIATSIKLTRGATPKASASLARSHPERWISPTVSNRVADISV
jgi:formylglycine-generating enzyme required for sulfatase activity